MLVCQSRVFSKLGLGDQLPDSEMVLLKRECEQLLSLFEKIYAGLDEAVFLVDPKTRLILSCSHAAELLFGYKKEEMIDRNTRFLHVNKEKYLEFGKRINNAFETKDYLSMEFILKKKDGSTFLSKNTILKHRAKSGQVTLHISIIRDMSEIKKLMLDLEEKKCALENKTKQLEEINITLKVLLKHMNKEKKELEDKFAQNINELIMPYLIRLRETRLNNYQAQFIDTIESKLKEMSQPDVKKASNKLMMLSPTETQVANYVKMGLRTKQISEKLNISSRTVEFHRQNIRRKICLKDRSINLKVFLNSL